MYAHPCIYSQVCRPKSTYLGHLQWTRAVSKAKFSWHRNFSCDLKGLHLDPSMATDRESCRWLVRVSVWPMLAWNMTLNDWLTDWLLKFFMYASISHKKCGRKGCMTSTDMKFCQKHFVGKRCWCFPHRIPELSLSRVATHRADAEPTIWWKSIKTKHYADVSHIPVISDDVICQANYETNCLNLSTAVTSKFYNTTVAMWRTTQKKLRCTVGRFKRILFSKVKVWEVISLRHEKGTS